MGWIPQGGNHGVETMGKMTEMTGEMTEMTETTGEMTETMETTGETT